MRTLLNVTLVLAPVAGSVMSFFSFPANVDFLLFLFLFFFFLWLVLLSLVMLLLRLVCDVGFFCPWKMFSWYVLFSFFFFFLFLSFAFYIFLPFCVIAILKNFLLQVQSVLCGTTIAQNAPQNVSVSILCNLIGLQHKWPYLIGIK